MKNTSLLIGIVLFTVFLTSCSKDEITPGNYAIQPTIVDTSHWQNQYTNGGSSPTYGPKNNNNELFGTNWILIDVYHNYAHVTKDDTIHFIANNQYTVGSDTTKCLYTLTYTMGNGSITFNQFNPINGLYLSANNFNTSAFKIQKGGEVFLNLKDNFTTKNNVYTSTFKKI